MVGEGIAHPGTTLGRSRLQQLVPSVLRRGEGEGEERRGEGGERVNRGEGEGEQRRGRGEGEGEQRRGREGRGRG